MVDRDLSLVVPKVACWSFSVDPKHLAPAQVRQLLHHCDRSTAVGRRDYAILLLLARLGLRAGEVVRLNLEDIYWENARITVCGKRGKWAQLPLPADVARAIARYLRHDRPRCANRRAFLRNKAPIDGFKSVRAISSIVKAALAKAGVVSARKGAHLLRHSLAMNMLRRGEEEGVKVHVELEGQAVFADLGALPAADGGGRFGVGFGVGEVILEGSTADLDAIEFEVTEAPDFAGGQAVVGGRLGGEAFAQEGEDVFRPVGGVIPAGGAGRPVVLLVVGTSAEIIGVELVEAAAGESELAGGASPVRQAFDALQPADRDVVFSLHEPQAYCLSKGKEHKKYEFGSKASVVMTKTTGVIVGAVAHAEDLCDGDALSPALEQTVVITGQTPARRS